MEETGLVTECMGSIQALPLRITQLEMSAESAYASVRYRHPSTLMYHPKKEGQEGKSHQTRETQG